MSASPVACAAPPESIADEVDAQERRIDQGIASGTLTRGEAETLNDNRYWIKSTHARMKADGRLNPAEIRKLDEMLDRNGAMICNKKHTSPGRVS